MNSTYSMEVPELNAPDHITQLEIEINKQSFLQKIRTVGSRLLLAAAISTSMVAFDAVEPEVVEASSTGGYPDANKPCLAPGSNYGKTTGTGYWCEDYSWGDMGTSNQISPRGFGYRNCTDWAAYRAQEATGVLIPYGQKMGHAGYWDDNAPKYGFTVDNTPEPGDVAVWNPTTSNPYGHVAIVESVNSNGTVNISEYNGAGDGNYRARSNVTAQKYIDLNGQGNGINNQPIGPSAPPESKKQIPGDFNGDRVTDMAVYRPSTGNWHIRGVGDYQWGGWPGDIPVPADYNGDKKTDIAIYRPQNGGWYIKDVGVFSFGWNGDIPVPGDYNGDGDAEIAVYRPSTGNWHIREVGDFQWGRPGDIPVPGYYNADDKLDIAIYRPENGGWYLRNIADLPHGWNGDIPVPADYTGDGITDLAIYRPTDGGWRIRGLGDFPHGWSTDVPVPGRYNNDAYADAAVYRPDDGGWRIRAIGDYSHGWSTDIPAVQTLNALLLKRYGLLPNY